MLRRQSFRDVTVLVVEQPDGTLTHVPEWMCAPAAGGHTIQDVPRLPLATLRALLLLAEVALSSGSDRDDGGQHGELSDTRAAGSVHDDGNGDGQPAAGGDEVAATAAGAAAGGSTGDRHEDGGGVR